MAQTLSEYSGEQDDEEVTVLGKCGGRWDSMAVHAERMESAGVAADTFSRVLAEIQGKTLLVSCSCIFKYNYIHIILLYFGKIKFVSK